MVVLHFRYTLSLQEKLDLLSTRSGRNTAMRYSTVYSLAGLLALVWAEEEFELETAVTVFETYIPVRALVSTISLISSRTRSRNSPD